MTLTLVPVIWRRGLALAYSAFVTLVLLQSSAQPVVGPAAPPGMPSFEREIALMLGHLVAFSLLTWVWVWAFHPRLSLKRALLLAVVIGLTLGFVTEAAQAFVPDRGASWFDVLTNTLAVLGMAAFIYRRSNQKR